MSGFRERQAYWADIGRRHHWRRPVHIITIYDRGSRVVDSVSIDGLDRGTAIIPVGISREHDLKLLY